VVVLNGIDSFDNVLVITENIRVQLEKTYQFDDLNLQLSPSIGVARYPDNGDDEQQLLQYADQAMYRAKNAGGNRVDVGVDNAT
jgi:diguanylate cyclase (GGDEF)-like protein